MRSLARQWVASLAALAAAGLSVIALAEPAQAATPSQPAGSGRPVVRPEVKHDRSPELRTLASAPVANTKDGVSPSVVDPAGTTSTGKPDPVVQPAATVGIAAATVGVNRDGVGEGFTGPQGTFTVPGNPPDPNMAVGKSQVVQMVNISLAVFDKSGTVLFGPVTNNTLFTGFGGLCETTNRGDPIVRYDGFADRWVISQFAFESVSTGPFFECVAVSQNSDALGAYNRYAFQYSSLPDYPKIGVWPDAYYVTYNLFNNGFVGAETCALDRAAMLGGATASQQCFITASTIDSLLPADADGAEPPPFGAPNIHLALDNSSSALLYWKFHVDWFNPANTTFTGPTTLPVAAYTEACLGSFRRGCIPQGGVAQQLESLSDRLMYRLAYRNFNTHESLVVNHAVVAGSSVGVRWYELRLSGGNPTVFQQSTFAPDANFRWMGSIAMDKAGNIALGYSASSSSLKPQVRVTGRLAGDPLNTLTQGETTLVAGAGAQNGSARWGDYSSLETDPYDGCTFWYTQEYIPTDGVFNWRTRLSSFTLPGCTAGLRKFAAVSGASFEGEPVATGTFLTLYTTVPVTDENQGFAFPWPDTTPGGMFVQTNNCQPGGTRRIPITFVGRAFGGNQINLYYPNDFQGGNNTEPFGTCAGSRTALFTLHPKPGFGADIRKPVELTAARPGFFLDFSAPNTPAGYHFNAVTGATASFATCNADPSRCPVATFDPSSQTLVQNFLIVFLGGGEKFGCPVPGGGCPPPLSGIGVSLAPFANGQIGTYVAQPLEFYGWAGFLGQEQGNVRIAAGTPAGEKRMKVTVPASFPQPTQQLTVRLGTAN